MNFTESYKRKSYTIKYKLDVIADYEKLDENGKRQTKSEISRKHSITPRMFQCWLDKNEKFLDILQDTKKSILTCRKVGKSGRKTQTEELDTQLINWVIVSNEKGLVVKDEYLQAKAVSFTSKVKYTRSKCSRGFIHKFKKRHNLVTHTHTSCRTIPENGNSLATDFIYAARNLIKTHSIKPRNIINFD
ncbi:Tigger transposable element-derived protein 5 [Dictyocoela muelleri]|nr:Tigger transposable element-derived protein 5 [Dictyocoela muelleri]